MIKKILLILLLASAGWWFFSRKNKPAEPSWHTVSSGIEWKRTSIRNAGYLGGDVGAIVLRLDQDKLHVVQGESKTVQEWQKETRSVAAINGGFFNPKGHSLGLRQSKGKELSPLRQANWGVFFIQNEKARILHTRNFREIDKKGISEAIQCGPRLVVDGKTTDLKNQWARRTGIGIDAQGKVLIAVCDSEISLPNWADFWADNLHCDYALNLDGGGSTQLILQTKQQTLNVKGAWPVPDALVIK